MEVMNMSPLDSAAWAVLLLQWLHTHGRPRPTVNPDDDRAVLPGVDLDAAASVSAHVSVLLSERAYSSKPKAFAGALASQGEIDGMYQAFGLALDAFHNAKERTLLGVVTETTHAELSIRTPAFSALKCFPPSLFCHSKNIL
jgi:hypothetical protein